MCNISLLCCTLKIFETCVKLDLIQFLEEHKIINTYQHGFLKLHSTCSNLLQALNDWSINVNNRLLTRVVFIDFKKAFDTVSHDKLLFKLKFYGLGDKLLNVANSLLKNRHQCVIINNTQSNFVAVRSGVAQGSVLGPLWFLLYINEIPTVLPDSISSKAFADDLKIYSTIKNDTDIDNLQYALDALDSWALEWQLQISTSKCHTLDIGHHGNIHSYAECELNGVKISFNDSVKDLGISINNFLSFSDHISNIVCSAKSKIAMIFRSFTTRDQTALLKAYRAFIRPLVEYCSIVWNPHRVSDIRNLESVQKLFTRRLLYPNKMSYKERLASLHLDTLELRRTRLDLFCFKLLNGLTAGSPEDYGLAPNSNSTRGHSKKLSLSTNRIDARKYFFAHRVSSIWSKLNDATVSATNIKIFKNKLKLSDLSHGLLFQF